MTSVPDPRPALLLVDVIKAFFDPRGAFHYPEAAKVLPVIERLLAAARDGGRLVVHARESHHPGLTDFEERKLPRHCVAGEFDAEFAPGFEPASNETEVRKRRYSAFFATDLALLLAEQAVGQVLVVGVKTNVCIRASVQDAFAHGFAPVLVRGASNSNRHNLHDAALEDVARYFGEVIEVDEGVARLRGRA
ncbi:MAG: cysteine hydrolase family protein [Candidatus Limnocylindria bacterium]